MDRNIDSARLNCKRFFQASDFYLRKRAAQHIEIGPAG